MCVSSSTYRSEGRSYFSLNSYLTFMVIINHRKTLKRFMDNIKCIIHHAKGLLYIFLRLEVYNTYLEYYELFSLLNYTQKNINIFMFIILRTVL